MPQLVKGAQLGGWLQLENSIGPREYHGDMQYILTRQQIRGYIYQSICFVGYENRWMPESFFEHLIEYMYGNMFII